MKTRTRRRVVGFSIVASAVTLVLFAGGLGLTLFWPVYTKLGEINQGTLSRIHCEQASCNVADLVDDTNFISADYVLAQKDHFFLDEMHHPGFWLEFSDPATFEKFRQPADWKTMADETWRFYSESFAIGTSKVLVVVGNVIDSSYRTEPPQPPSLLDGQLINEAKRIFTRLRFKVDQVVSLGIIAKVDGYQVIDEASAAVIDWGGGIPAYLPHGRAVRNDFLFVDADAALNIVRTDNSRDLIVVSLQKIGSLWLLLGGSAFVFLSACAAFYFMGSTVLKRFLILLGKRTPTLSEAFRQGEGQEIEFKRGIVDDDLLRSVAAFSNTNDGTIFVGVDDDGKIIGIKADTPGQKSAFAHKVYGLIRQRITPIPPLSVEFEGIRDRLIAKVIVARGDERLYFLDGIIYVRHGDSDVKGEPSVVTRILEQYA